MPAAVEWIDWLLPWDATSLSFPTRRALRVTLTPDEVAQAKDWATRRRDHSRAAGWSYENRIGTRNSHDQWNDDARNYAGEIAFCRWHGATFDPESRMGARPHDPSFGIESRYVIRSIRAVDSHWISRRDEGERCYILTYVAPELDLAVLIGWATGDAEFRTDARQWDANCWYVPQVALRLMEDLP